MIDEQNFKQTVELCDMKATCVYFCKLHSK